MTRLSTRCPSSSTDITVPSYRDRQVDRCAPKTHRRVGRASCTSSTSGRSRCRRPRASSPIPPSSRSSSLPAWPTNGKPCLSSWKPGASPTNIRSAAGLPTPKTTCVLVSASRQRVQPADLLGVAGSSSVTRSHSFRRNNLHLPPSGRSWAARRCRELRTRRTASARSRRRSRDTTDPAPTLRRAPRNATRTPCTRTRRSASPRQCSPSTGGYGER